MKKKFKAKGIKGGLTNYGDPEFSSYLRKSFAKSMGYTDKTLDKPIVGIINTASYMRKLYHPIFLITIYVTPHDFLNNTVCNTYVWMLSHCDGRSLPILLWH